MDFSFMNDSVGKTIQIERGGPDKIQGTLLSIKGDHLVLGTNDGVVYVNTGHIKTISEPILREVAATPVSETADDSMKPTVLDASNFTELLSMMEHKLVKINQAGPNSLQGVLLIQRDDCVTIVHNMKDYVHYPLYHIKTITWVVNAKKEEKKEEKQEQKQEQNKDNKKEEKKDNK